MNFSFFTTLVLWLSTLSNYLSWSQFHVKICTLCRGRFQFWTENLILQILSVYDKAIILNSIFQVLLSERPEYNDKIHCAYLLAPPVYMTHATNFLFQVAQAAGSIEIFFHLFGQYEFLPHSNVISWLGHFYCDTFQHPVLGSLCENIAFIIAGVDKTQLNT